MRARTVIPVALAALAVAFAGCASASGGGASGPVVATTAPATGTTDADASAAWLDGGRLIGLVTSGSSTCVPTASDATFDAGVITVTLADPDGACTRDLVPRVTLVTTPEGVDPTADVEIRLAGDYSGDADLDGVAGLAAGGETDFLPSAGWTGDDGQLVILTFGSSSCPPVVESVTATSDTEVTVAFEVPPADQVCTMDIGPRAAVVTVDGIADDAAAQLVLTGGSEFATPTTIPIVGTP